jgi:hypothetical protein
MKFFKNKKDFFLKKKLINFEKRIAHLYEKKKIKGPIHLSGNNEAQLINIFKNIKKKDWVFLFVALPQKIRIEKKVSKGPEIVLFEVG